MKKEREVDAFQLHSTSIRPSHLWYGLKLNAVSSKVFPARYYSILKESQ